ncbi:MAG: HD-GYP domain-containing protein [Cellvibrionaceae bacterium]
MPVKKIDAAEVEIGMYVSRLDRPWNETPFLFQGFPVRDLSEIEELKKQCRHVYIMVPDEEIEISAVPAGRRGSLPADLVGKKKYQTTTSAREEVQAVHQSHDELVSVLWDVESMLLEKNELKLNMVEKSVDVMIESIERNPDAYIWLNRIKKFDSFFYRDALNASVWAATLGRELGLEKEKLNALATGALVMDIGKTALPAEILNKTDKLTDDEWAIMKTHVEHGVRILSEAADVSPEVLDIVRTHHERLDGSGYPAVLKGDSIPLLGQIAGIVDFYVSVTTPRPYAQAVSSSNAVYMLYQQQGHYFSEALVKHFIQAISTYPTGSLVELSSGEVGVVISQNPGLRLRPNVLLLLGPDKKSYDSYPVVSLVDYSCGNSDKPVKIAKTLAEGTYDISIEELTVLLPAE